MPRLMGVDIPGKKHTRYALRYIHGIGPKRADDVLAACNVEPSKKADDLTQDEIHAITTYIQDHYRVEGDLRREVSQNIRRLISIGSYRGLRHKRGLPVRGQRTKTNAKTRKGNRKATATALRATAPSKRNLDNERREYQAGSCCGSGPGGRCGRSGDRRGGGRSRLEEAPRQVHPRRHRLHPFHVQQHAGVDCRRAWWRDCLELGR